MTEKASWECKYEERESKIKEKEIWERILRKLQAGEGRNISEKVRQERNQDERESMMREKVWWERK